jgi:hypothetical protein
VSPRPLGPDGVVWNVGRPGLLAGLDNARAEPVGPDVLIEGDVHRAR